MAIALRDFHERVAAGERPAGAVLARFSLAPVDPTTTSRAISFTFSDNSVDAYGDTIDAKGWQWDKSRGVPALFGHDPSKVENVVGRGRNIRVSGDRLVGDIDFAGAEVNPVAEQVYRMVRGGYINSVSVGFQPIDWQLSKDPARKGGIDFKKQKLLEISVVPIPANENALTLARAAGIDVDRLGLSSSEPLTDEELEQVRQLIGGRSNDQSIEDRRLQVRLLGDLEAMNRRREAIALRICP